MTIHHVYANRSNAGDWMSAKGIQMSIDLPVMEHLCDSPFVAETLAALARADNDDLIVVGGGGLFMDYFEPLWEGLADLADNRRIVVWGAGYVDLKAEQSRAKTSLLMDVLSRCHSCFVRDELTRSSLPELDLPHPVPCPSIVALSRASGTARGLLHVANYTTVGALAYEQMCELGRQYARATGRPYSETDNRLEAGSETALASLLEKYLDADTIISSGLHGCIFAFAMGKRVVAVSGDRKIEAFMEWAGLGDWVIDHTRAGRLLAMLEDVSAQHARPDALDEAVAANRSVAALVRELASTT